MTIRPKRVRGSTSATSKPDYSIIRPEEESDYAEVSGLKNLAQLSTHLHGLADTDKVETQSEARLRKVRQIGCGYNVAMKNKWLRHQRHRSLAKLS
jgi:hypothetical protein